MKVLELFKQLGTHYIPTPELNFGSFGGDVAVAAVELSPDVSSFFSRKTLLKQLCYS